MSKSKAFQRVRPARLKRNMFNLSYPIQATIAAGKLIPIFSQETIPGDIFRISSGVEIRTQPLVAPLFGNLNVEMRYFYVPNRLVWPNFTEFLMGKENDDKGIHIHPYIPVEVGSETGPGTLADFFGVPTNIEDRINALPFRAYNLIYNEFFRDQNLQDAVPVRLADGEDSMSNYEMKNVCWSKDYFTSALPWTQAGSDVDMHHLVKLVDQKWDPESNPPLSFAKSQIIVDANYGPDDVIPYVSGGNRYLGMPSGSVGFGTQSYADRSDGNIVYSNGGGANITQQSLGGFGLIDPNDTWEVEMSLLELRKASALQRFLERSAMVGSSRYADWLRGMYGVSVGDYSLQRPQYLGGGKCTINVSSVEQTSSTDDVSPQGSLAGKGYVVNGFKTNRPFLCAEHGWIIGMMYVRPTAYYSMGLDRSMIKENRFDYFLPGFEHIGEQEILKKELFALSGDNQYKDTNNDTFGYQERYAQLKWHRGMICGEFKDSLSAWVMPRQLQNMDPSVDSPIALNGKFVECDPNLDNNFAVSASNADQFLVNCYHFSKALRTISYFPNYKLI